MAAKKNITALRRHEPKPGILASAGAPRYAGGIRIQEERTQVVATNAQMKALDIKHLYDERGDCENIFDEMKNQWGWKGFTAHSLKQTALFAGLSVIASNLWNIFTRLGNDVGKPFTLWPCL